MAPPEKLEKFERFHHAAQLSALTDLSHDPNVGVQEQTSGTELRWIVPGRNSISFYYQPTNPIPGRLDTDLAITTRQAMIHLAFEDNATWIEPLEPSGRAAVADPKIDTTAAISLARAHHLNDVADRLALLFDQPLDEDEVPLDVEAAVNFVNYCVARKKKPRPLMAATPSGELGITWKGPKGEKVLMRFFADHQVWVAYKLKTVKGSFEINATDLISGNSRFDVPDWA